MMQSITVQEVKLHSLPEALYFHFITLCYFMPHYVTFTLFIHECFFYSSLGCPSLDVNPEWFINSLVQQPVNLADLSDACMLDRKLGWIQLQAHHIKGRASELTFKKQISVTLTTQLGSALQAMVSGEQYAKRSFNNKG